MNLLFCSVGRRGELIKFFKKSLPKGSQIIATDNSKYAPALYFADKQYIVPKITEEGYIDLLLDICKKEGINAITTFIDPEIAILSENREKFEELGILVLAPRKKTAELCFDKYKMYQYCVERGINTVKTYSTYDEFYKDYQKKLIQFPIFVKPRTGSGSVGARKIDDLVELEKACREDHLLIIQEFMDGIDLDADVYVDSISNEAVKIFTKKKIETKIGGANKTISFKDENLFDFVQELVKKFEFVGPNDMDFFYKDGKYYLSEVNPRFGGAYLHAYGAGVDFVECIVNNIKSIVNEKQIGEYEDDVVMMMYDSVVIKKIKD